MEEGQSETEAAEATETAEASLVSEETDYDPKAPTVQEAPNPVVPGLDANSIVRVVIQSGDPVMEEVVSSQNVGHGQTVESFTVSDVLQQTQMVTGYESTMVVEGIVEDISESKT